MLFCCQNYNARILLDISSKEDLQLFGLHCFVIILPFFIFFNNAVNKVFETFQTWPINYSCSNLQSFITDMGYISAAVMGLLCT